MRFTVTARPASLCCSCADGHVIDYADGRRDVFCAAIYQRSRIVGTVTRCSYYTERGKMSQHDAEKIAWVLEVNPRTRRAGFRPPKEEK